MTFRQTIETSRAAARARASVTRQNVERMVAAIETRCQEAKARSDGFRRQSQAHWGSRMQVVKLHLQRTLTFKQCTDIQCVEQADDDDEKQLLKDFRSTPMPQTTLSPTFHSHGHSAAHRRQASTFIKQVAGDSVIFDISSSSRELLTSPSPN